MVIGDWLEAKATTTQAIYTGFLVKKGELSLPEI
jgi:hypothetical protein